MKNHLLVKAGVLLLWVFVSVTPGYAKTKTIEERLLETPELDLKKVTLAAIQHSESFRTLAAKSIALSSDQLLAESITDTVFTAQWNREWNRNQAINPFGTVQFTQSALDLSLSKRLQTGTQLTLGLTEFRNVSTFGGGFGSVDAKSAGARIQIDQSLWRDFFGSATRQRLRSGNFASAAARIQLENEIESWFVNLADLYYQAWLTQRRVESTQKSLQRRETLSLLFQRRKNLGISEEAEDLQVQAALEQSRVQLQDLRRALKNTWNLLIITLKLPADYRDFDPVKIPLKVESIESFRGLGCERPLSENRELAQVELQLEAAVQQGRSVLDSLNPDLRLNLGLNTNRAILNQPDQFGTRWGDTFNGQFPAWTAGLFFQIPFGRSQQRAESAIAVTQQLQLESKLQQLRDQIEVNRDASCAELQAQERNYELFTRLESSLDRRVMLEQTRYRQARIQPFQVLQAGDEWLGASLSRAQSQVQWWSEKWKLERIQGNLFMTLDKWVQEQKQGGLVSILDQGSMGKRP